MTQKTPQQMLKEVNYAKVKTFPDPITRQPIGSLSRRDLVRIVYILNTELFKLKNDLDTLKNVKS